MIAPGWGTGAEATEIQAMARVAASRHERRVAVYDWEQRHPSHTVPSPASLSLASEGPRSLQPATAARRWSEERGGRPVNVPFAPELRLAGGGGGVACAQSELIDRFGLEHVVLEMEK